MSVAAARALVLGATGHAGNALVRRLLERGWRVTAVSRRPAANLAGLEVATVYGDLDTPGRLEEWVPGHELVVDAAAPYPLALSWSSADALLERAVARTTRLLAAVGAAGSKLAHVSSFVTLAAEAAGGWPERLARRLHPYFACKRAIEAEVLSAARRGLRAIVVNPTSFLGPWDLKPRRLSVVAQLLDGRFPIALDHEVDVIDVRDVAAGLMLALEAERWGEPILLAGHRLPVGALGRWLCELAGVRPPRALLPAGSAIAPACLAELVSTTVLGRSPSGAALAILLACSFDGLAAGGVQHELGLVPRPLSLTLHDTVAWYGRAGRLP